MTLSLAAVRALDAADPFAGTRARFALPPGVLYLDGNSLGPLQHTVARHLTDVVATQWGEGLIRSWNTHDWLDLPARVGARIAPLIGADAASVTVTDSTSINLFKLLAVAVARNPGRTTILSETHNFPTDLHVAQGLAALKGQGVRLRTVTAEDIPAALDADCAVLLLTEVNYRTGARHDMAALTRLAHDKGMLTLWDLAHSAGAFPVDLSAADTDFALGCGYKYLNGGPGAPSFVYVAPRHLPGLRQPLSGWMGAAQPFAFDDQYEPAPGINAMRVGTPPILSLSALEAALDAFSGVDMAVLRTKADGLFDLFTAIAAGAPELDLVTPRDPARRGTQASFRFPLAYEAMQALIEQGVIGDFRTPDIMRFGLTPLYLSYEDVFHAGHKLVEVITTRAYAAPRFAIRNKVV